MSRSSAMVPQFVNVRAASAEAPDIVSLTLDVAMNAAPGQFVMLTAYGIGEIPIGVSRIHNGGISVTVRAVGLVSQALTHLEAGDQVGVRGPFGRPWPLEKCVGGPAMIVTGGLGLSPLRPVIDALLTRKVRNPVTVIYGARAPDQMIYANDRANWASDPDVTLVETVDFADPEWKGRVGTVIAALDQGLADAPRTAVFTCGPEIMMRLAARQACERGVAADRIFLSLERNMKCAIAHCGRCQFGGAIVCREGPVFNYADIRSMLQVTEL